MRGEVELVRNENNLVATETMLLYLLVSILVLALLYLVLRQAQARRVRCEGFQQAAATVLLVHADFCGHCKHYLEGGAFDAFRDRTQKRHGGRVRVEKLRFEADRARVDRLGVSMFPTILALRGDGASGERLGGAFSGDRDSAADLDAYADAALRASSEK